MDVSAPSTSSLGFRLEHPLPILPNFKYQTFDLKSNGRNSLDSSITFEGQTYNAAETVSSTFDLSHDDIVLYYEILDNWINLDIGLDLKRFDGEVSLTGSANTTASRVKIDETLPLFYLSARFDLPFTGFYVGTDVSSFSINDSSADDVTIMLGYESDRGLGIEGGIRTFSLELDDADNLDANIEYEGAFVSGYYHF
ncbi:MAG: outer membrane protein [Planctomycetota bacterium]